MNKIVVLDIETGGLNPQTDGICSISYKELGEDNVITHYIKPYALEYNEEALKINRLSLDFLEGTGVEISYALNNLLNFLSDVSEGNKWNVKLMGHNLKFDLSFLEPAIKEHCKENLYDWCHYHYKDTMHQADTLKEIGVINPPKLKLTEVYKYLFGEDNLLKNAHSSSADVEMTEKIHIEMIERGLNKNGDN